MKKVIYLAIAVAVMIGFVRLSLAQTKAAVEVEDTETFEYEGNVYKKFVPEDLVAPVKVKIPVEIINAEEVEGLEGLAEGGEILEDSGDEMMETEKQINGILPINAEKSGK